MVLRRNLIRFALLVLLLHITSLRAEGTLDVDITLASGQDLDARLEVVDLAEDGKTTFYDAPAGKAELTVPAGDYRVYCYAYDNGVPILVDIRDATVRDGAAEFILINLFEGSSGVLRVRDFDDDGDLVLNRVEIEAGTNPWNAAEIPGRPQLPMNMEVLKEGENWYRGELNAYSEYGDGSESVKKLIRRAEKEDLDFLAITDRNTMASVFDEDYSSKELVLIPAMEWGDDENGVALIYAPQTMPDPPLNFNADEAQCVRIQAQGGAFAIAHPLFSHAPWKRGLGYANAVQVWRRGWREPPPLSPRQLPEALLKRDEDDRLITSIAAAAKLSELDRLSANAQAERFWDFEMARGLIAAPIAGSGSGTPKIPLGKPVTYIRARNKSLPALMEGLRNGRTFISSGLDGPELYITADLGADKTWDVGPGGVVPLRTKVAFVAVCERAEGMKLQIIRDGRPLFTKIIESKSFAHRFEEMTDTPASYRARIIGPADEKSDGFGPLEVYAMTSPIFSRDVTASRVPIVEDTPELRLPDNVSNSLGTQRN